MLLALAGALKLWKLSMRRCLVHVWIICVHAETKSGTLDVSSVIFSRSDAECTVLDEPLSASSRLYFGAASSTRLVMRDSLSVSSSA